MTKMPNLSVAMIVKDEEEILESCLEWVCLKLGDELQVVVVDGGSTDNTLEICRLGSTWFRDFDLIQNPMPDSFAEQRNLALANCEGDWVLQIDADETYNSHLLKNICEMCNQDKIDAWAFPTFHLHRDENHYYAEAYPDYHIRLFRNDPLIRYEGEVHELITGPGVGFEEAWSNLLPRTAINNDVHLLHWSLLKSDEGLRAKGERWMQFAERSAGKGVTLSGPEHFVDAKHDWTSKVRRIPEAMK